MTSILIGYFPKRRTTRSNWVSPWPMYPDAGFPCTEPVEEICSVSDCIAQGPERWRDRERHNVHELYDTPELAQSVVPAEVRPHFELFAYRLLLVEFRDGKEAPIEPWWKPTVAPKPCSFVRLGWDAVVGGEHRTFGCSPMSCNAGSSSVEVAKRNRFCLVSTKNEGLALARHFSIAQPEPGPYCVVEVWRHSGNSAEQGSASECADSASSPGGAGPRRSLLTSSRSRHRT